MSLVDLSRYRGDTYPLVYSLVSKVTLTNPVSAPVDLTGWSFTLTINADIDPIDETNQLAQVVGLITDATGGVVEFPMTGTLAVGNFYYDIQSIDESGYKKTQGKAKIAILQDITKI